MHEGLAGWPLVGNEGINLYILPGSLGNIAVWVQKIAKVRILYLVIGLSKFNQGFATYIIIHYYLYIYK